MCDVDMRGSLYANLMVTGGNSLIMGFTERLNHDLAHRSSAVWPVFFLATVIASSLRLFVKAMKLRVTGANMPMERRCKS